MKTNPTRYSSAVGEVWVHFMFKIKYCHKIFDDFGRRNACKALFLKAFHKYDIQFRQDTIGFDSDHLHAYLCLGIRSKPELCKLVKGYVGRKFFKVFSELKLPRDEGGLFWGSGLFSPATFGGTPNNEKGLVRYIQQQRYGAQSEKGHQARLTAFA